MRKKRERTSMDRTFLIGLAFLVVLLIDAVLNLVYL